MTSIHRALARPPKAYEAEYAPLRSTSGSSATATPSSTPTTSKSLERRAAYVDARRTSAPIPIKALEALVDQEKKAYEEAWEIELAAATHHYSVNDFDRGKESMDLTLTTAEGEVLYPISW